LSPDDSLKLLGVSVASNDLLANLDAIGKFPKNESSYFFYNCISIVRELAKLVASIQHSKIADRFSATTSGSFEKLSSILTPYHDASLVKSTLKPIRDFIFHYDFSKTPNSVELGPLIDELSVPGELDVALVTEGTSPLDNRYSFADSFRSQYANRYLSKEVVSEISTVSVYVVSFVDYWLADLVQEYQEKQR